jgi:hypothetical protein
LQVKKLFLLTLVAAVTLVVTGSALADLNEGLVAYYPFSGNANDESGMGNNGTVSGALLTTDRTGRPDSAYSFDGLNDYVSITDSSSLDITEAISLVVWIKPRSIADARIISKREGGGGYELDLFQEELRFSLNGSIQVRKSLSGKENQWIFIAATWEKSAVGDKAKVYISEDEAVSGGYKDEPIGTNDGNLLVGSWYSPLGSDPFDGVIDDIRVYNRALSEDEVRALYATEWPLHKTEDSLHPDPMEQQAMWLMNRARANPTQEGIWLANIDDPDVTSNTYYQNVDKARLQLEFSWLDAKPPTAFDRRLYYAAKAHSEYMIQVDSQTHDGQFDRIGTHGFHYISFSGPSARANIFWKAKSGVHCHATWNVDWGFPSFRDDWWMQPGRGHRMAVMSVDGDYTNVGIALVGEQNPSTQVGPLVATGNYCRADTNYAGHYNRFLVGTVWEDLNGNNRYDPGEGKANIKVMPDHGMYYAVTSNSGGYAVPITSPGTYHVVFSGPSLAAVGKTAVVGEDSLLLDLELSRKGDINGDGRTDLADAMLALQIMAGLNPDGIDPDYASSGADVNGDGKVGWEELVYILQVVLEERS